MGVQVTSEYPSRWKLCTTLQTESRDEVEKEGTSQSLVEIQQQLVQIKQLICSKYILKIIIQ